PVAQRSRACRGRGGGHLAPRRGGPDRGPERGPRAPVVRIHLTGVTDHRRKARSDRREYPGMITGQGIRFAYDQTTVLSAVDLSAAGGEVVGLIGPNGSGKSTLLKTLYGALGPQAGLVTIDDTPLADLGPRAAARQVAVVTQEAAGDLPFTVSDIVALGRTPHLSSFQR